jgi:hypothetical protein
VTGRHSFIVEFLFIRSIILMTLCPVVIRPRGFCENMAVYDDMQEWLRKHPNATIEDAWLGGYWTSCDNWCKSKR